MSFKGASQRSAMERIDVPIEDCEACRHEKLGGCRSVPVEQSRLNICVQSTSSDPAAVQGACPAQLVVQCWDELGGLASSRHCQVHQLKASGGMWPVSRNGKGSWGGQLTWMRQQRAKAAAARISGCTLCRRSDRWVTAPCSATAAAICTALGVADSLLDPGLRHTCTLGRQACTAAPVCTMFEVKALLLLLNIALHHTWRGVPKMCCSHHPHSFSARATHFT